MKMDSYITPVLKKTEINDYFVDKTGCPYLSWEFLSNYIDIPDAKHYWVEFSKKQFKERNGILISFVYTGWEVHMFMDRKFSYVDYVLESFFESVLPREDKLCDVDLYVRVWYK